MSFSIIIIKIAIINIYSEPLISQKCLKYIHVKNFKEVKCIVINNLTTSAFYANTVHLMLRLCFLFFL